jgi:sulfate adenylyltransferase subunit 2
MNARVDTSVLSHLSNRHLDALEEETIFVLREVVERRGLLVPVTELTPPRDGEEVEVRDVRCRTVGDLTCPCPVDSEAATAADIVLETLAAEVSERGATRMDDKTSEASMEKRKKDGYF